MRTLPSFVRDHILVAFYRDQSETERHEAHDHQSYDEHELQTLLNGAGENDPSYPVDDVVVIHDIAHAEGITSWDAKASKLGEPPMHRPVLDIDFEAALIPSSTPGHYHLYLDKLMTINDYEDLIDVLGRVGIIEPGYADATIQRGYSSARLPWVKKHPKEVAA